MNQKGIHWFPGHMKKAFVEIENRLKLIDVIIEIVDARAPLSTKNPFLEEIIKNKKKILVFSKVDLVDKEELNPFIKYYESKGYKCVLSDIKSKEYISLLKKEILNSGAEKHKKEIRRGMKPQNIRVMIIGIPNVGKSSLINALVGKNSASKANKPGHTKAQQWIRFGNGFDLLDTPGVLPPHYEDKKIALHLALIGSIPEEILPISSMCDYLLDYLMNKYKISFEKRFNVKLLQNDKEYILKEVALSRGLLLKEGKVDEDACEKLILKEFKEGLIAKAIIDTLC